MPRIVRVAADGAPHHVTQRGNNRQQVFFSSAQRRTYLALLAERAARHRLRILGYCLMPNHVHAVVVPERSDSMARGFGRAHNSYSHYFHTVRRRSGHLWQNRFYSAPLGREHLTRALCYAGLNPVRASLAGQAPDYAWSSARAHLTGRDPAGLLDLELWREVCPPGDWEGVLHQGWAADSDWAEQLRAAKHSGKPLTNQAVISELEAEAGNDPRLCPPGRPPKKSPVALALHASQAS